MRDIKFRVWDNEENNFWGEGRSLSLVSLVSDILVNDDSTTLEQYTGLKDKNGVEIYEGDLIEVRTATYRVEWFNTAFWVSPVLGYGNSQPISNLYEYTDDNIFTLKVIGNIHENADLLN